jgi:hypothetical protein
LRCFPETEKVGKGKGKSQNIIKNFRKRKKPLNKLARVFDFAVTKNDFVKLI